MYWPVGPCRRGLHSPSSVTFEKSNNSKVSFASSMTVDQTSSCSSASSDTDDTVIHQEEILAHSRGSILNSSSRKVKFQNIPTQITYPYSTGSTPENWTLWSVWSEGLNELLEDIRGRRIQLDQETFINAIYTIVRDLREDFPVNSFLRSTNCQILKLEKGSAFYGDGIKKEKNQIKIPVTSVILRPPGKKADSKQDDLTSISCIAQLADILGHVLQGNEILLIYGGVIIRDKSSKELGKTILDLNNVNTWNAVHIVRLNPTLITGEGESIGRYCLMEIIKPEANSNYTFSYAASGRQRNSKLKRYRKVVGDYRKERDALEEWLFPILKHTSPSAAFKAVLDYDWTKDPTWPSFNGGTTGNNNMSQPKKQFEEFTRYYEPPPMTSIRYYDHDNKTVTKPSPLSPELGTVTKSAGTKTPQPKRSPLFFVASNERKKLKASSFDTRHCFRLFFILGMALVIFGTIYFVNIHAPMIDELKESIELNLMCGVCSNFDSRKC